MTIGSTPTKLDDPTLQSRGSEWRKWDVQIHTPASHLNNQFGSNWDEYVQNLFRTAIEKDIAVIGITDYFTIDGYKKVRQEYLEDEAKLSTLFTSEEIQKIRKILLLPNVEFRLDTFVGTNRVNCHVILSDEVSVTDIEEHFLHDLNFTYQGEPQKTAEKRRLKIANLKELGERLIAEHPTFADLGAATQVGMINAVVDDEDITKTLKSSPSRFGGKYLFGVVADEDLSDISWDSQDHHTRKVLIQQSDVLFSSNPKTRAWALGKQPYTQGVENYLREFRTLKPCLHGSDAHDFSEIGHPCAKRGDASHSCTEDADECDLRYCWIKADTTFEGLKQTLYEPEARVSIQSDPPILVKSTYSLDFLEIDKTVVTDGLSLRETIVPLNRDLVAVIGGRGRGKTAFVDLLANMFVDRAATKDPNSFVRRIARQAPALKASIRFVNGETFSKELTDKNIFEGANIVYIAQGELETYIGEDSDLQAYVNELIFQSPQIKDSVLSFEYTRLSEQVDAIQAQIDKHNQATFRLEVRTSEKELSDITRHRVRVKTELDDTEKKVKIIEEKRTEAQIAEAKKRQQTLARHRERKQYLLELQELVKETVAFLRTDIDSFNANIEAINRLLKALDIQQVLPTVSYSKQTELEQLTEVVTVELTTVVKQIETFQRSLDAIEAETKRHTTLLDKKGELERLVKKLDSTLEKLQKEREELEEHRDERINFLRELVTTVLSLKRKYDEVIAEFAGMQAAVLTDLDFTAEIRFNEKDFLSAASDVLDGRSVIIHGTDDKSSDLEALLIAIGEIIGDPSKDLDDLLAEFEAVEEKLKTKIRKSAAIGVGDFYKFLYANYFSVVPVVRYKNTDLDKLSLGQKATVLIKIYLAQDDRPIIIDSHDDHLDNEFIMDELVTAIREAKNFRQVILVSNNGNVVVNSDSEQVIVTERDNDGEISYIAGSLENPSIRQQAVRILEGGEKAFKRRQEKYRMSRE